MEIRRVTRKIGIIVILSMSLLSFLIGISTVRAATSDFGQKLDVRFIVDVSYPMKKYDQHAKRVKTLQKIIKSLPDDAKSGVWTYGKYVNMLVPLGVTTPKWKKQAVYKLNEISGYGDYRNLDSAINKALHGWQNNSNYKKHLVILTNGDLKVSNSRVKNARSQLKLLTKTLAKMKKANIQVHAVSLSKDADNRLLKILASQTNGKWYSVANVSLLDDVVKHAYANIAANTSKSLGQAIAKKLEKKSEFNAVDTASKAKPKAMRTKNNTNSKTKVKAKLKYKPNAETKGSSKHNADERKEADFNWPTVYSG